MGGLGSTLAALGHSRLCMRAKMNRYDLSLWDVGKRSLYVEKRKASKPPLVPVASFLGVSRPLLNQDGIKWCGVAQSGKFFAVSELRLRRNALSLPFEMAAAL